MIITFRIYIHRKFGKHYFRSMAVGKVTFHYLYCIMFLSIELSSPLQKMFSSNFVNKFSSKNFLFIKQELVVVLIKTTKDEGLLIISNCTLQHCLQTQLVIIKRCFRYLIIYDVWSAYDVDWCVIKMSCVEQIYLDMHLFVYLWHCSPLKSIVNRSSTSMIY